MKQYPEVIYLVQDKEDSSHMTWQTDQPADGGCAYVKKGTLGELSPNKPIQQTEAGKAFLAYCASQRSDEYKKQK